MKRIHKCSYEPALIIYRPKKQKMYCDLASYCPECGKIGPCLDNSLRIADRIEDGRIEHRVKTNDELYEEFKDKLPVFDISDWEQEKV